ncbi:UDP-2,3-diacylglucosamine diphosphatase [Marinomonas sp. 15G1-11]|uniref:UDP-2,3-diacylglucosamine diphosphatase n=1 Tax=Marinomonas phaeophyticola TaxID=3004091 RepID=A0ABT4JSB8_9GAMM|nr:UDP-2,3-diacylglucosamine diphosphatase [Marinomonas sp. 15G1-11]MCZ2720494.1 UDP-2,3-diacylglucosamine diphosphatase [Marinomonas sp. 15G1-11]
MQTRYRSVFISDVHLGTRACQANHLLDFLNTIECETLYLVGDIIDLYEMQKKAYFTEEHRQIISLIMQKAREGTKVIYIPGNHDAFFRQLAGQSIAGIDIKLNDIYTSVDGRQFYVSHGDEFDQVVKISPLLLAIGDRAHGLMLNLNNWVNGIRKLIGRPYWSFANYIKNHINKAKQFISRFEQAALKSAESHNVDGFICGHIHYASFRLQHGKLYCNDGDWVEDCSALVESEQGVFSLLHWSENPHTIAVEPELETQWGTKSKTTSGPIKYT